MLTIKLGRSVTVIVRTCAVGGGRALWQRDNGRGKCGWKGVWVWKRE